MPDLPIRPFPRVLGILMEMHGLSYLIHGFALRLAPAFAGRRLPANLLPAFISETLPRLWPLARSVNPENWRLPAGTHAALAAATVEG